MNASVKVMNSYNYCHFEVVLSAEDVLLEEVDSLRKEAQRLVDKAIMQYKIAKQAQPFGEELKCSAMRIKDRIPESEWTPEQKAIVKQYEDFVFYSYQDDWEYDFDA